MVELTMTANRRILLNIVATYGRSLYALVIGLFCGRWTLMALGQVDYGLVGLVGGLACFVSFFNSLLASAVGRFYAVSVGAAQKDGNREEGLEECRRWFNTAASVHWVLPTVLIVIGYPLGIWAVEHFLSIPPDRIGACVWVWRFTCLSCFIGMFNVPFQAMYTAKQEIAELTLYGFATTTFNALFLYYIVNHPACWLVTYSAWTCALSVVPQLIIAIRAVIKYPECKFHRAYLWNWNRILQIVKFAYASLMPNLASMISGQAKAILVNKYMGPQYNASMTIGGAVTGHTMTLSSAISGAMWPAVANKAGEGDEEAARKLIFIMCRLGGILVLVFALPLALEVSNVLRLWLVNPPPFTAELCVAILIDIVFSKLTDGYSMAFSGFGRGYVQYCNSICLCGFSIVFVAWLFFALGLGMWGICVGTVFSGTLSVFIRLYCGRKYMHYSVRYWLRRVFLPTCTATSVAALVALLPRLLMSASLWRVVVTTVVCELVLLPTVWLLIFEKSERSYVLNVIGSKVLRMKSGKRD